MRATVLIASALLILAALDSAFAGFRAAAGRTGLVRHRRDDTIALRRGLTIGALLLTPGAAVTAVDLVVDPGRLEVYVQAGRTLLTVYLPYGLLVLLALAAYATLSWRKRFLATALLLGPLTLLRPVVAITGAVAAWWITRDAVVGVVSLAAVAAVLAVEPIVGRRWYAYSVTA